MRWKSNVANPRTEEPRERGLTDEMAIEAMRRDKAEIEYLREIEAAWYGGFELTSNG